jgi:hypothetical protein
LKYEEGKRDEAEEVIQRILNSDIVNDEVNGVYQDIFDMQIDRNRLNNRVTRNLLESKKQLNQKL